MVGYIILYHIIVYKVGPTWRTLLRYCREKSTRWPLGTSAMASTSVSRSFTIIMIITTIIIFYHYHYYYRSINNFTHIIVVIITAIIRRRPGNRLRAGGGSPSLPNTWKP